ncbi:MAG: hypothetical protein ABW000_23265 [Actinoplanes sp.]
MRSLGSRRAVLATGVAAVAAVALAACSSGQVAETSLKKPSNQGVNADNSDRSVFIRNLAVEYKGTEGYQAGDSAPLELGLFNQTTQAITVLISSQPLEGAPESQSVVSGSSVGLTGGSSAAPSTPSSAIPEPSGSRSSGGQDDQGEDEIPSADPSTSADPSDEPSTEPSTEPTPEARPARIEIGPLGSATFLPGDDEELQVLGLTGKLAPGSSVNLLFEFSNGAKDLTVQAPVGIPLTPASRAPGLPHENTEE